METMMRLMIIMVMMISTLVRCQDKPRVGQDGRPLLNKPKVDMCMSRPYHETYGNHHYFLSWREPWNKFEDWDWFNARYVIKFLALLALTGQGLVESTHVKH